MKAADGTFSYEALSSAPALEPWDGTVTRKSANQEGTNSKAQAESKGASAVEETKHVEKEIKDGYVPTIDDLELEPPLSAEQSVLSCR